MTFLIFTSIILIWFQCLNLQVDVAFNNDKYATYTCNYTPEQEGMHQIKVFYAGLEIPKSPFSVEVAGSVARVAKITANGQGLQKTGNMSNIETSFTIRAKCWFSNFVAIFSIMWFQLNLTY